jgi:hypothetical protein
MSKHLHFDEKCIIIFFAVIIAFQGEYNAIITSPGITREYLPPIAEKSTNRSSQLGTRGSGHIGKRSEYLHIKQIKAGWPAAGNRKQISF